MPANLQQFSLPGIITAIGGLGTAAFGVVEALKPVVPSINRIGFGGIRKIVAALTPPEPGESGAGQPPKNALSHAGILRTLESNWINGNDLGSQKAIAKSLIKLHLSAANAPAVAQAANVDAGQLTVIARYMAGGSATSQPTSQPPSSQAPTSQAQTGSGATPTVPPLNQQQSDLWSRFDLIVTAMLDDCYQCADQAYRNWTRGLAAAIAIILAVAGAFLLWNPAAQAGAAPSEAAWVRFFGTRDFGLAILVGLLATPLAPVAKDITTALAQAVNTMQLVKKP